MQIKKNFPGPADYFCENSRSEQENVLKNKRPVNPSTYKKCSKVPFFSSSQRFEKIPDKYILTNEVTDKLERSFKKMNIDNNANFMDKFNDGRNCLYNETVYEIKPHFYEESITPCPFTYNIEKYKGFGANLDHKKGK